MIEVAGTGSVSAAGSGNRSARDVYTTGRPTWSTDAATGLPVYRSNDLPATGSVAEFAHRTSPDRTSLLALHAADEAVKNAGWQNKDFAILVGCSRGPTGSWEETFRNFLRSGSPPLRTSPKTTLGSIGFALADYFGKRATLASSLSVTCSSGMHALLHGIALLHAGMVERVLVGGTEAPITTFTLRQMEALRVYAKGTAAGEHACLPFSDPPTGMVIGEGAGFLALQNPAVGTGPRILGIGFSQEHGQGMTGISREGEGLQIAMRKALDQARVVPDLIVPHAPGTKRGDAAELAAIAAIFVNDQPKIRSFKWATGHTFGASGPLGVIAGLADGKIVMVNATGFGGNCVSVIIGNS